MNIKNWFSKLGKGAINQVDDTIVSSIMSKTKTVVDDILKSSKSSDEVLRDLSGTLKNNQTYRNIYSDAVEEASRVKYGKTFDDLKNSTPNEAKALAEDIHKNLSKDITDYLTVRQRSANAKYGSNKQAYDKLTKNKNATSVDLNQRKTFLDQSIADKKIIDEFKKVFKGLPTSTYDDILEIIGKPITQTIPDPGGTGKNILKFTLQKNKYKILFGLGIGGAAIWALYSTFAGNNDFIVTDENGNTIPIDSDAPTCLLELLKNNEASVTSLNDGSKVIKLITSEFPSGLLFYNNFRVENVANGQMGTYKCMGTQVAENKSKKLSLYEIATSESSEIDLNTMTNYVDTAVDDLDGYVNVGNLNSLYSIVSALKGKTFQGKDALQQFMILYSEDEGGDDFKSDVNSVGVRVLGTKGIVLKNQILDVLSGGSGSSTTSTGEKIGLKNIKIFWDGEKIEGGGGGGGGTQPKYFDCSQKDFPYEYGCIAPKIAEIQTCKGITPNKGYFGPKTKRALGYPVITKELYDNIMAECGKGSTTNYDAIKQAVFKGSDEMIKKGKENVRNTYQNTVNNLSNNLYPTSEEFETIKNKLENYRELSDREKQIYNKYSEKFSGYPSAI
jgi:hypothetical protein